jgi:2-oxoisovalerate dehydrogenase E1 component
MVKQIDVKADFNPGFIERDVKIPVFQYEKTAKDELEAGNITPEHCLDLIESMLLIRNLEEMIVELKDNKGRYGALKQFIYVGASHVSIGQEAISTGAIAGINSTDYITSTHRGHGDSLAKGYFAIKNMTNEEILKRFEEDAKMCEHIGIEIAEKERSLLLEDAITLHLYRAIAELLVIAKAEAVECTSLISVSVISVLMPLSAEAWEWLSVRHCPQDTSITVNWFSALLETVHIITVLHMNH